MEITIGKKGKEHTIALGGSVAVANASDLRDRILEELGKSTSVSLDLEGVESMGLSALQVITAAHKSARNSGKGFAVKNIPPHLNAYITAMGYVRRNKEGGTHYLWDMEELG